MAKAHSSLTAAKKLWEELLFAESISRSYYAMFYAAKALLLMDGIDVSKHSAVAAAFGREYVKTGKIDSRYHRMLLDLMVSSGARSPIMTSTGWLPGSGQRSASKRRRHS